MEKIYNLKNQITELKLQLQNNSEISRELEISKLKEENSFLKLQLSKENYEKEKKSIC